MAARVVKTAELWRVVDNRSVLTAFGVVALSFMMVMYALEHRHRSFVAAFALGCALSSAYGFASGAWPFGGVEAIWTLVASRRWRLGATA
jgi:hypothetical protein